MEAGKPPSKLRAVPDRTGANQAADKFAARLRSPLPRALRQPPPEQLRATASAHQWMRMLRAAQAQRKRQTQSNAAHRRAPAAPSLQEESCHQPAALWRQVESSLTDLYPQWVPNRLSAGGRQPSSQNNSAGSALAISRNNCAPAANLPPLQPDDRANTEHQA